MRRVALLCLAACGRVGFGGHPDAATAGSDAPGADAAVPGPPQVAQSLEASSADAAMLSYALTVPSGTYRLLLVTVQVGSTCTDPGSPSATGVSYANVALTRTSMVLGLTCDANSTRTEVWQLVAPPVGTANVIVQLSASAMTLDSGAVVLTGINQATPVRVAMTDSGQSLTSTVAVPSEVGDLVVDFVGQGTLITAPGNGDTLIYLHNVSPNDSLDNIGASSATSAGTSVAMSWTFSASDYWQTIGVSLVPAQ